MGKILRSKPVLLAGTAAIVSKLKNKTTQKRRKAKTRKTLFGLIGLGLLNLGIAKYFTDPLEGQRRREKIRNLVKGKDEFEQDWQPVSTNSEINVTDAAPAPTPQI